MPKKRSAKPVKKTAYKLVGKKAPIVIKIISILMCILALLIIIMGVALFIGGVIKATVLPFLKIDTTIDIVSNTPIIGTLILAGLLITFLDIVVLLIARGLWIGSNWSRVLTIVLMAMFFISAIFYIDIITIIVSGLIGGYLWFSKSAKRHFAR